MSILTLFLKYKINEKFFQIIITFWLSFNQIKKTNAAIICKLIKSKCFKTVNSTLKSIINKLSFIAWITKKLFKEFFKINKKIIIIVDNAFCHLIKNNFFNSEFILFIKKHNFISLVFG